MPGLNIQPNIAYLKTPQAILKIVQIVTLLIAFSCITDCCDGGKPYVEISSSTIANYWTWIIRVYSQRPVKASDIVNYNRNVSFFLAVTILGWLLVVFFFAFFFLRFNERFKQIKWEMVVMIISIVWSVLLLLCCSLMGSISSTAYTMRSTGSSLSALGAGFKRYVDAMATGVVFGFFSLVAFIVDAALLFWQFWSKRKAGGHGNGSTNNPAIHKVSEAPGPSTSTAQDQTQTQVPPTQKGEAPPRYEAVPSLPGQMPNTAGQTVPVPYTTGQTVPYAAGGQTAVTYPSGQTVPYAAGGQAGVAYPSGQQYQTASGQPVMWQMA